MTTSTNKIEKHLLPNSKITDVGVYILFFKGYDHYYIGSSKVLTQRLYHYLNPNDTIISKNVRNMIDASGIDAIQIQIFPQDPDISAIDLLKKEDEYLAFYHRIQGDKFCLNSRNNANTWHSQTYKTNNKQLHKPVATYCKYTKELLMEFESITAAVKYYKYDNSGNVVANLKGKTKTTKGMFFQYI